MAKHNITKTAATPLPANWSLSNPIMDKSSEPPFNQKSYQQIVGDIIYLGLTNTGILHANSAVTQKTHYCSKRDYEAVTHILEYINGHPKQGIIYRASREPHTPLTEILDRPIAILFSHDGAHNPMSGSALPRDQAGYYEKLYDWENGWGNTSSPKSSTHNTIELRSRSCVSSASYEKLIGHLLSAQLDWFQ